MSETLEIAVQEAAKSEESVPVEADVASVELGKWMGRREAFGLIAGRCSAAEIESLRRIKDGKLYQKMNCTWEQFCVRHLHVASRTVERDLAQLRRFGAAFFTLRQLTRVGVREYATIAAQVSEEGVHLDGAVVPLLPENTDALAGAVETLLRRHDDAARRAAEPPPFSTVLNRFHTAAKDLRKFRGHLNRKETMALTEHMMQVITAAKGCGVTIRMVDA